MEFFEKNNWTEINFMQYDWTKHPDYNCYFLGEQKNNEGETIKCNGVCINADTGYFTISSFNEQGKETRPLAFINFIGFKTYEN